MSAPVSTIRFERKRTPSPQTAAASELAATLAAGRPDRDTLRRILTATAPDEIEVIRQAAEQRLLQHLGDSVRLRGLIEFSNRCVSDCYYCGIRRSNRIPERYTLEPEEIVETARWCGEQGYGSVVLQSGERRDAKFTRFIADTVHAIKDATRSDALPQGVGITLCVGEQSADTYAEWFAAGAHRYLLRVESSSPRLFSMLHPPEQTLESRIACLKTLKSIGYRVGTGVMIGLPGQSIDDLVDDLFFFRDIGADMIGMVPYIPHEQAAMPSDATIPEAADRLQLALRMIAATPSAATGHQHRRHHRPAGARRQRPRTGAALRRQRHHAAGHTLACAPAIRPLRRQALPRGQRRPMRHLPRRPHPLRRPESAQG